MERDNYFGAILFWLYIVAALLLTGFITTNLWSLYRNASAAANKTRRRGRIRLFSGLSALSFSVLSYHMLYFLIDNYKNWALLHHAEIPRSLTGVLTRDTALKTWEWSHTSTLFRDFARELCEQPGHYWWTCQALLFSFQWNVFMAVQGTRFGVSHLWTFFVLGQILPTSFAQNLFCTAVLLSTRSPHGEIPSPERMKQGLVVGLLYVALLVAPLSASTAFEMPMLFVTRVLLAGPFFLLKLASVDGRKAAVQGWYSPLDWSVYMVLLGSVVFLPFQTWMAGDITSAVWSINESWAVSALGYDYLIGVGSFGVFVHEAWNLVA